MAAVLKREKLERNMQVPALKQQLQLPYALDFGAQMAEC
jgi:hypothetical protein